MRAVGTDTCFCYILKCVDGSFYTGWTTNLEQRLEAHNSGRGSRYTRARRPVQFVLVEPQADRRTAMRRERTIKNMPRRGKMELIAGARPKRKRRKARSEGSVGEAGNTSP